MFFQGKVSKEFTPKINQDINRETMSKYHATNKMFTVFSHLPSELRLKIWQQACIPRLVTVTYNTNSSSFTSATLPPALLAVNRESRCEARRIYSLSFGTSASNSQTYFNPVLDTLYMPRYQKMGYDETLRDFRTLVHDPTNLLDQIRCMAVDHVNVEVKRPWESYNKAVFLRSFKQLDAIKLILNPDGTGMGDLQDDQELPNLGDVAFGDLTINPEHLLNVWYYFRQSFMMEEKMLEDVCRDCEREYEAFELPTVRILAKVNGTGDEGIERARREIEHMQSVVDIMRS